MENSDKGSSATRAKNKYNRKNYDQYLLTLKKGEKERYQQIARSKDVSLNSFIIEAIEEKIQRESP